MSSIKPTAIFTAIGAGLGGVAGFFFGSPMAGAQIGAGLGLKVGVANKAEEGIDAIGRKVETIVDKTNEKLVAVAERIADTWATVMLCGYTWQIANAGARESLLLRNEMCKSMFESIDCFSLAATTFSINTVAIVASAVIIFKIKEFAYDEPRRRAQTQVKNA